VSLAFRAYAGAGVAAGAPPAVAASISAGGVGCCCPPSLSAAALARTGVLVSSVIAECTEFASLPYSSTLALVGCAALGTAESAASAAKLRCSGDTPAAMEPVRLLLGASGVGRMARTGCGEAPAWPGRGRSESHSSGRGSHVKKAWWGR